MLLTEDHSILSTWKLFVCNICKPQADVDAFVPVSENILKEMISHTKMNSDMNPSFFPRDNVSTNVLKEVTNLVYPSVLSVMNSSLTSGSVQSNFKHALV